MTNLRDECYDVFMADSYDDQPANSNVIEIPIKTDQQLDSERLEALRYTVSKAACKTPYGHYEVDTGDGWLVLVHGKTGQLLCASQPNKTEYRTLRGGNEQSWWHGARVADTLQDN